MGEKVVSFEKFLQGRLGSLLLQENEILIPDVTDQIQSLISKLDEVGSFLGDPFVWTLHVRELAKAFLTSYEPVLTKEGKDQMVSFITALDEVTGVSGDGERIRACYGTVVAEIRGIFHEMAVYVDDFIIKLHTQTEQDQKESAVEFGSEMEKIRWRVTEIMNRRPRLGASPVLEDIKRFLRSKFDDEGTTPLVSCMLRHINLPYDLKLSLQFCCVFRRVYGKTKSDLVRVLVAAGLILEKSRELMEDRAQENIERLVDLGMLEEEWHWDSIRLRRPYDQLSLSLKKAEDSFVSPANSDSVMRFVPSLFFSQKNGLPKASLDFLGTMLNNAKFLKVLDLENTQLENLPDEIGNLVHLRFLGVTHSRLTELPENISNLQNLQTLDLSWSDRGIEVSNGVLNLVQLRHLKLFQSTNDGEVRVPQGISRLRNLQSLEGIYAGGGIAEELGIITQLRSLEVRCFSDDHADELYVSVMKLTKLRNLSLTVERERCLTPPLLQTGSVRIRFSPAQTPSHLHHYFRHSG